MKSCFYKAVVGVDPRIDDCHRLHPYGCDGCLYYLPDPPVPEDKDKQDAWPESGGPQ